MTTNDTVLPPEALRERVTGTKDPGWFVDSGARTVREWLEAAARANVKLADCNTVVDYGCGCGRALGHLVPLLRPSQDLIGLDTDQEAIAWLQANVPRVSAFALNPIPPAPVAASSVDLILSHSVFTHLPEDMQDAWLADLARLLKPAGVLVTSFHGRKVERDYFARLVTLGMEAEAKRFSGVMDTVGFFHVAGKAVSEVSFPEYYGAAFHRIDYIVSRWLVNFELVSWLPVHALSHQDVVVLRRKW